ncbi:hypothetical protein [Desulfonatronovibrio hydrogenovorans]|uniref:VgrG-related protein n=1 Tax=Desulfonatronovibrio hydrogenovorans TaxID=53245 RepID=UPI00123712DB|nr:hypothetical protein [Desulfonatronovibrio hydrogenovorans]
MIIKQPEQHMMAFMRNSLSKSPAAGELPGGEYRLFEMIMNNNLAAALPPSLADSRTMPAPDQGRTGPVASDRASEQPAAAPTLESGQARIRMPITVDTPRYASNAIRQKIDFSAASLDPAITSGSQVPESSSQAQILEILNTIHQKDPSLNGLLVKGLESNLQSGLKGFQAVSIQTMALASTISSGPGLLSGSAPVSTGQNRLADSPAFRDHAPDPTLQKKATSAYMEHAAFRKKPEHQEIESGQKEDLRPGSLAARFESADRSGAIGYDRMGGTCYGIYQLSSRMGTLDEFLTFLDTKAPDLSQRLRQSGPGNTGSRTGAMPEEWKKIDEQHPRLFADLQHQFIYDSFYLPAARGVKARTGLDIKSASSALREVLWSTAVQHGVHGAMNIFQRAAGKVDLQQADNPDRDMIQAVYQERKTRFSGSSDSIRTAVHNRFSQEMKLALAMLPGTADTQA